MPTITYNRPAKVKAYKKQLQFIDNEERFTVVEATTKAGKAQPLDAMIKTPTGNILMNDVKVGQAVLTPTGKAEVIGIYPQGVQDVYRIEFSDRSSTECTLDHLWEIHYNREYKGRGKHKGNPETITQATRKDKIGWPRVLTLKQILLFAPNKRRMFHIPLTNAVEYEKKDLKIHPYLMGVLLGDGGFTSDTVILSSEDEQIINKVANLLPEHHSLSHHGGCDYAITAGKMGNKLRSSGNTMMGLLRHYKLNGLNCKQKFIPEDYKFSEIEDRKELLRGLFDTDGFVDKHGQIGIELTSKQLIDDIQEIVESLGGIVKRGEKENKYKGKDGQYIEAARVYRMYVQIENHSEYFSLDRKKKACTDKKKPIRRSIRSITRIGEKECQCIEVSDERGLYLTNNYIATHNTSGCIVWIFEKALSGKDGSNYWWVAPTYAVAKIAFRRMKRYIEPKSFFSVNESEHVITLATGSKIFFKSAENPDNLYGEDVFAAVIDEGTRIKEESWQAIFTTLTATEGECKIIGNVKGTDNWVYRLAREAETGNKQNWKYYKITAADAVAAGILKQDVIDEAERTLPKPIFLELYYAIPFVNSSGKFCFSFDVNKHVGATVYNPMYPVYISFDFNKNPICCSVFQQYNETIFGIESIKLPNSNIYELCRILKVKYGNAQIIVNGDATGQHGTALVKDNLNYYTVIRTELGLGQAQFKIPSVNPRIEDNQLLVNAILEHYPVVFDKVKCSGLIHDCQFVEMNPDGTIKKGDRTDPNQQADQLDCWRYFINANFKWFLKQPQKKAA